MHTTGHISYQVSRSTHPMRSSRKNSEGEAIVCYFVVVAATAETVSTRLHELPTYQNLDILARVCHEGVLSRKWWQTMRHIIKIRIL